jgi:hypothetical protein
MIKFLFLITLSFASSLVFSQSSLKDSDFIYGKMIGKDTLVGYFHFDKEFYEDGVTVFFRKKLTDTYYDCFPSKKYFSFESGSMYLESFEVARWGRDVDTIMRQMIPRVIKGTIELFEFRITNSSSTRTRSLIFFTKKDEEKEKIIKPTFKRQMASLVGDDEALMERINKGELRYQDMPQIVELYNAAHPMAPAPN